MQGSRDSQQPLRKSGSPTMFSGLKLSSESHVWPSFFTFVTAQRKVRVLFCTVSSVVIVTVGLFYAPSSEHKRGAIQDLGR